MSDQTSADEKLTEKDALQQAADQGIRFSDHYRIMRLSDRSYFNEERYDTKTEAEKAMYAEEDSSDLSVAQVREALPQTDEDRVKMQDYQDAHDPDLQKPAPVDEDPEQGSEEKGTEETSDTPSDSPQS